MGVGLECMPDQQRTLNKLPTDLRCRNFVGKHRLSTQNRCWTCKKKRARNVYVFRLSFHFCMPPLVVGERQESGNLCLLTRCCSIQSVLIYGEESTFSLVCAWSAKSMKEEDTKTNCQVEGGGEVNWQPWINTAVYTWETKSFFFLFLLKTWVLEKFLKASSYDEMRFRWN